MFLKNLNRSKYFLGCLEKYRPRRKAKDEKLNPQCLPVRSQLLTVAYQPVLANLPTRRGTRYRTVTAPMDVLAPSPLRLALVGMSGAGKTFWTKKLAAEGWTAISCDDCIEQKLASRLAAGGHAGINGVAAWMGWPDNPKYAEREAQYLEEEIHTLGEALTGLERDSDKSVVLDTTGSVIYAGNNLLLRLRRRMTVVYLAASAEEQQLLIERYLSDPKPVLWRGAFKPKTGETPRETVARCYPMLMSARRQSYEALAHCTLQVAELRDPAFDTAEFLSRIQRQIERPR
jgi:shikimate kinase